MNIDRLLFFNNIRTDSTVRLAAKVFSWLQDKALDVRQQGESEACARQPGKSKQSNEKSNTDPMGLSQCAMKTRLEPDDSGTSDKETKAMAEVMEAYFEIQRKLLERPSAGTGTETFWKNYLCHLVEESENTFSLTAEKGLIGTGLHRLAENDLEVLMKLYSLDWETASKCLDQGRACVCAMKPDSAGSEPESSDQEQELSVKPAESGSRDVSDWPAGDGDKDLTDRPAGFAEQASSVLPGSRDLSNRPSPDLPDWAAGTGNQDQTARSARTDAYVQSSQSSPDIPDWPAGTGDQDQTAQAVESESQESSAGPSQESPVRPTGCVDQEPSVLPAEQELSVRSALSAPGAAVAVDRLAAYYHKHYCGILGKYRAFVWDGQLTGVEKQDPITFDDLIGYENAQQKLIQNTRVFVDGMLSNNVLLYGDKGTGKSSSVKALLNLFGDRGLRMINMPKSRIGDITAVMKSVSQRACKFIIFIDDLSFEDTETEYKHFKSILEGGVEVQPTNVLIYVTSNRRNLVKETWKDRSDTEGEIHLSDGIMERQSLSDRFGLKIPFLAPSKKEFMEIVMSMARKEALAVSEEVLLREANIWDMRQTSRSGRSAKQFIIHLAGRLAEGSVEDGI